MIKVSDKQVEEVSKLEPIDRYNHSIGMIADTEEMYSLLDGDGNWELAKIEDKIVFIIWPHEEYIKRFLTGEWSKCSIEAITIDEFNKQILGYLKEKGYLINVFPNDNSGFIVLPEEFCKDLEEELEQFE